MLDIHKIVPAFAHFSASESGLEELNNNNLEDQFFIGFWHSENLTWTEENIVVNWSKLVRNADMQVLNPIQIDNHLALHRLLSFTDTTPGELKTALLRLNYTDVTKLALDEQDEQKDVE